MQVKRWPGYVIVLMLAAMLSACGDGGAGDGAEGTNPDSTAQEEEEEDYRVVLGNALADTLEGRARFGFVFDPDTGRQDFIIELETGFDFAGGFFVVYGSEQPPAVGTHDLSPLSDSLKGMVPGAFTIFYRQGMLRDLSSREGTVTFSTVSDTLVEGTFDARLRGFLANAQGRLPDAEVHARGRFRAHPGNPGFIVGL